MDQEDEALQDTSDEEQEYQEEDVRYTTRTRAIQWAVKACEVGKLVNKPRGKMTPEKQLQHKTALEKKAQQLITRVVIPTREEAFALLKEYNTEESLIRHAPRV